MAALSRMQAGRLYSQRASQQRPNRCSFARGLLNCVQDMLITKVCQDAIQEEDWREGYVNNNSHVKSEGPLAG